MAIQQATDPFVVIETETPRLPDPAVHETLRRHYGLAASLQVLVSERDQNFRLRCADGRQFVLKIANAAEDPQVTDFQIQALLHLESQLAGEDCPVVVPRIVRTVDEQSHVVVNAQDVEHVVRVVSWVDGHPLGASPVSQRLCRRMGACLAHLGNALRGFEHPASAQSLLWDMQQAPQLRKILPHIHDASIQALVARALEDFERFALPSFATLRKQVIHSDFNPENILVERDDPDTVAGVIDFGDMLHAPLLVDAAVGASYLRATSGNPLFHIAEFLAGYHSVTPFTREEIDLLPDLIRTRLAASIAILAWRTSLRGAGDAYLAGSVASESEAPAFLDVLTQMPREDTQRTFRQVCAAEGM